MIIKFPTGLYDLPSAPSDNRSVTFMVSNEEPPRTNLVFPKIPPGIVDRKRTPETITLVERRGTVGDLVFSVSRAARVKVGNNTKQFETGTILSFGDEPIQILDPMLVSEKTETQHDLNIFDYATLGITDDEQQLIANSSIDAHNMLTERLNDLKRQRADAEMTINVQQKIINEANKNIDALEIIANNSTGTDSDLTNLITKLKLKRQEAFVARDIATNLANMIATEADNVVSELRTVATVLK